VAAAALVAGLVTGGTTAAVAQPAGLSVFEAFTASRTVTMQPRAAAVLSLVVEQYVGATHALLDSGPRAQGYAATYGIPVANDLRGAGIPLSYGGQCYANYPGEAHVDCGVPVPGVVAPRPPEGGPVDGGVFFARATANGDPVDPEKVVASGVTESGGIRLSDIVDIGSSRSRSRTFIDDKGVHAVTASTADNVQVGQALHIDSILAVAEAVHDGDLATSSGKAATDVEGVTIGGVPVVIGADGVMVQGARLAEAKTPDAEAVRTAMASEGLSIEPVTGSVVTKDESSGYINATTSGFRVLLRRPSGDRFDLTFGEAMARATAVRSEPVGGSSDAIGDTATASPYSPQAAREVDAGVVPEGIGPWAVRRVERHGHA
jgi:hypothetical protein